MGDGLASISGLAGVGECLVHVKPYWSSDADPGFRTRVIMQAGGYIHANFEIACIAGDLRSRTGLLRGINVGESGETNM
jgi:hypothetical protein